MQNRLVELRSESESTLVPMRTPLHYRDWVSRTRLLFAIAALLLIIPRGWALDPKVHITQYSHTAWRTQDGFFAGSPLRLSQTLDGYLWIGTANGLFRFDGVRFVPWADLSEDKVLASANVSALFAGRDGSLWIGAGFRLYRWKDNHLTQYSSRDENVSSMVEAPDGTIWFARSRLRSSDKDGVLCRVQGTGTQCVGELDSISLPFPNDLVLDADGNFWICSGAHLVRWRAGSKSTWALGSPPQREDQGAIETLLLDRQNTLWAGLNSLSKGSGLGKISDGRWKPLDSPEFKFADNSIRKLLMDHNGSMWVGTEDHGIYRITDGKVDHFDSRDGLSSDAVRDIYQDHEGTLWVATSKGIDSFHDSTVVSFSQREGLHLDRARSILSASDKTIWIGNNGSLDAWRNGAITSLLMKDGLFGRNVTSLLEDPKRGLWVGIGFGLYLYDGRGFKQIIAPEGPNLVMDMALAKDGSVWIALAGVVGGDLFQFEGNHLIKHQSFADNELLLSLATDTHEGLWIAGDKLRYWSRTKKTEVANWDPRYGYIRDIAIDGDDFVWFGATKSLVGSRASHLQAMTVANGLPCERINSLITDNRQALWLDAQCGLIKIEKGELQRWWSQPKSQVKMTIFDGLDGFKGGKETFHPAVARSSDGRLWFVNGSVVQTIDPEHLNRNELPPPIHIERVVAETKSYPVNDPVHFPKSTKNIEINYTGLSFVIPQRVRFRYKLQGYDTQWQEVGSRRSAFYTNLRPAKYTFQVIGCNNDGVWSDSPATIQFDIAPAFHQTIWFRFLLGAFFLGALVGVDSLRVRQATARIKSRLEERLEERGRIARELHDTLIQSVDGLMIYLQAAIDEPDSQRGRAKLEKALDRADEVLAEGRERVHVLRLEAVEIEDLAQSLTEYAEKRTQEPCIGFSLVQEGCGRPLDPLVRDEAFRIGREALSNAFEHSAATKVEIIMKYDRRQFGLTIIDNGTGIPEQFLERGRPGHWGLTGMRERARYVHGDLTISSNSTQGTTIELLIPARFAYPRRYRLFSSFGRTTDSERG
ncbi:sensor histidine kinase [Granulicella sp. S190]|uniref:sensor histidine kinase n=1 Tax=Granulicella sp. S190 TaxID=1747226 RepID=UPI00131B2DA2|nr:sensor histidine kinase [Granulicella sp. S190]